jgi:hypothetical protein
LLDADKTEAISLDYHGLLESSADSEGNLRTVSLSIPGSTSVPESTEAIVLLDLFPLARVPLSTL